MVSSHSDKIQIIIMETKKNNELDVIGLFVKVLKHKISLSISLGVAIIIGVIVALNQPKSYTSQVMLAPEISAGGVNLPGNLSDIASNFGIDLNNKSSIDAIYPEIYPSIVSSTDFLLGLFNVPVHLKDSSTTKTYKDHLLNDQKVPFYDYPKNWILSHLTSNKENANFNANDSDKLRISKADWDLCGSINNSILCTVDKKTSVISISVTDTDPMVATILADTIQHRLQTYITQYRTKKTRNDVEYYKKLMTKAKKDYETVRRHYTAYSDSNIDVVLESVKSKTEDIENDMQLKYNTYTALNSQYQAAVAKLLDRTPAFTIIQKPYMPYRASSTPRSFVVLAFMIIGFIVDCIWVFYKERKNNKAKAV